MKKIFIIIVLLSVIAFVSPKFIGGIVETEYQSALNKLDENPAITIKSTTFNRDWFRGQVVTEMTIYLHHEGVDNLNLVIKDDLYFGPVVFTDEGIEFALSYSKSKINFTDLIIDDEIENFIKNKIHLSTLLTFSKDIVTRIAIDEVSKEVDGNTIVSAKALGKFVLENENRVYGDFNWAGLSATTAAESLTIETIHFSLDQTLIAGSYYQGNAISTGDFDFSLSSLKAKDAAGNPAFSLNNLHINAMSSANKDLMEIKMNYSLDKLETAGQQLEHANLDVAFKHLDINVMQEASTFLAELSDDEVFSSVNMNKLSALTTQLLENDPVIEIEDFSVVTPEGKIESTMQVHVDKKQFDATNFMSIMTAINATATGNAPMAFFNKLGLTPVVQHYVEQGFIIQKGDKLSVNVNYKQSQLNINGNVISL
jgi:uncharacterized protein YdgA (DUF945 family)